ncbi:uridine kinase [Simkania negevensis]|uniref:Uridine kinase n=1 Tax=Simkania negevensis (strain ATCC VR-1471 / DSM 27360 / Z) TaxID=331113 RepID=F8L7X7_SIMNZ|nr:uridine kinase [Simkania negevensis]CCB88879.1 uridine kinase [Simkania negevensis Z]
MKRLLSCFFLLFLCQSFASETLVVGIAGASGAGKTTLARKLVQSLGQYATLICQDSYYQDLSHLPHEERARTNFDHPSSIDFELMRAHILALKEGKNITQPIYDFTAHSRTSKTTQVEAKKILVVEGCLLLAIPEIRELLDIKLFVDTDLDICLMRRIQRDQKERGRTFQDIQNQYFVTVRPMFFKFIAPSKVFADMIIPAHHENEVVLNFIASKLHPEVTPELTLLMPSKELIP